MGPVAADQRRLLQEAAVTPASPAGDLESRCVNAVRVLAIDGVEKAHSGHPGTPMGLADAAYLEAIAFGVRADHGQQGVR